MIPKQSYKVMKSLGGDRIIVLASGAQIPADVAGLAVGQDSWLAAIECKCRDCGALFPLRELNGGGQWCEECQLAGVES
jgi:hypothetical protein